MAVIRSWVRVVMVSALSVSTCSSLFRRCWRPRTTGFDHL